ncbi:MAG: hypothetical protein B7X93_05555 [Hydrogenophilales bacterium 17-61-9]|nr:MAG: hypothetical protein B7X93_05555 [Hydrogenophilales bacterium 17-61-9]
MGRFAVIRRIHNKQGGERAACNAYRHEVRGKQHAICRALGVALLLGGALTSPVQARVDLSESDFLDDLPLVLSASRLSQPLNEAPVAVSVIDQDMIRASGFRDIPDLLRLVPGFSVAYSRDNTWAVGYHGMADAFSRRFQVLVDGRSIYNAGYGAVNWGELPLSVDDIERIEVVRGPNAASYGANAFMAVVNIVSKDPSQTPGAFASVQYGEQGMAGVTLRHGGSQGDLRYRMTLSAQARDRFETHFREGSLVEALNEETRTNFLNGRADYRISATDEFSAQFGVTVGDWRAGSLRHPEEPPRQDVSAQYVQFKYRRAHSADDEWMVQAYFSRNALDAPHVTPLVPPLVPAPTPYLLDAGGDAVQTRANIELQVNRRLAPDWRMVWGAELRRETVRSQRYFDTRDTLDGVLARAYANLEWRARPGLLLQGKSSKAA